MATAVRPACSIGTVRVVSGGLQKSAPKMSSQPTRETSPGTSTPRSRKRASIPIARRSLNAMHAVAPACSTASAAAAPAYWRGANGPTRKVSTS